MTDLFKVVTDLLLKLHDAKNYLYRDSWKKRGEVGIAHNSFRKVDRIEGIVQRAASGYDLIEASLPSGQESLTETVADDAVYKILWLTYIAEARPDEFKRWAAEVEKLSAAVQEMKSNQ